MKDNQFKTFNIESAKMWGKEHYSDWLTSMQNQNNIPQTPVEQFFRYYTQGIHHAFNRALRSSCNVQEYCEDSFLTPEMFYGAIEEINKRPIIDDVITYRYLDKGLLKKMLNWSGNRRLKTGTVIFDRGFLSTTLTPYSVSASSLVPRWRDRVLMIILVPKNSPCVYLDLISDMHENELLFSPSTKLKIISRSLSGRYIKVRVINDENH